MELCEYDLETYIKKRESLISIKEIKYILNQLNNILKILIKENIIHLNLKPNNILISLSKLDNCTIKLSTYKNMNILMNESIINETLLTIVPEILKEKNINIKNDIWSLGIIIYYILNKKYPYNDKNEISLYDDINIF